MSAVISRTDSPRVACPEAFDERYLKRAQESVLTLQGLAEDLLFPVERDKDHEQIRELSTLREACRVTNLPLEVVMC